MPLVVVNRRVNFANNDLFSKLIDALPEIVAGALTCDNPDGKLTAVDIEVWTRDANARYDRGVPKDVQIVIFAGEYPERRQNLQEREQMIRKAIKKLVPQVHGWVWILPIDSVFGEF